MQDANKFLYKLNEHGQAMTKEQAFDFGDVDGDKMDEAFLCRLYGSYTIYEGYGKATGAAQEDGQTQEEDRSINAHNCRKTSMLSKMFFIYKLMTRGFSADLNKELMGLFASYASQYLELISVATDLGLYIPLFTAEQRTSILATLKAELDNKAALPNKLRHARAFTSFSKFEFMFREQVPQSLDELK